MIYVFLTGGMNDVLNQFDTCNEWARRYAGPIVVDTSKSSIYVKGYDLFQLSEENCPPNIFLIRNDNNHKTLPKNIHHNNEKPDLRNVTKDEIIELLSSPQKTTELNVTTTIKGGGNKGWRGLRMLRLDKNIVEKIKIRLLGFPRKYVAVHIRNSDYSTDYEIIAKKIENYFSGQDIVICTDSVAVQKHFRTQLKSKCNVIIPSPLVSTNEDPLHLRSDVNKLQHFEDIFVELIAIRLASFYYYGELRGNLASINGARYSGFSTLAHFLRYDPEFPTRLGLDLQGWELCIHATSTPSWLGDLINVLKSDMYFGLRGVRFLFQNANFFRRSRGIFRQIRAE